MFCLPRPHHLVKRSKTISQTHLIQSRTKFPIEVDSYPQILSFPRTTSGCVLSAVQKLTTLTFATAVAVST